jgi:phosphoserine aminotransferase
MNVPFLLNAKGEKPNQAILDHLLAKLKDEGFSGLKGHRSIGGMRASIYNSLEYESVVALCEFLEDYMKH